MALNKYIKIKNGVIEIKENAKFCDEDVSFNISCILKEYKKPLIWSFDVNHNNRKWDCGRYSDKLFPTFFVFYKKEHDYFLDIGCLYIYHYNSFDSLRDEISKTIKLGTSDEINIVYKNLVEELWYYFPLYINYYNIDGTETISDIIAYKLNGDFENYTIFTYNGEIVIAGIEEDSECVLFINEKQKIRLIKGVIDHDKERRQRKEQKTN